MTMEAVSRRKQYVSVNATYQIDGTLEPQFIIMAKGPIYKIDSIKGVYRSQTYEDHPLTRYRVMIQNTETILYCEKENGNDRWYVEIKEKLRKK